MLKNVTAAVDIIVQISPIPIIHKVGWTPHLVRALWRKYVPWHCRENQPKSSVTQPTVWPLY